MTKTPDEWLTTTELLERGWARRWLEGQAPATQPVLPPPDPDEASSRVLH